MAPAREGIPIILSFMAGHVLFLASALLAPPAGLPQPWLKSACIALAVLFAVLSLFSLYFFRDPERPTPSGNNLVVCPADGKVLGIEQVDEPEFIGGPAEKLSIFMNVFDVHVNRAPLAGTVGYKNYRPGKFLNASLDKASVDNEAMSLGIESARHGKVLVRQIAGLIARRIVCRVETGDSLERGERFGLIRFGSRVEVFISPGVEWKVKQGDRVIAGETVLAEFR
ncbi:MAG: phosphatidylserine decarboxylase family protein [Candidatus Glassbacteria bacterium]|nr:phosphatidylserine decarboxylase family protein [Candidatus Glassbacteria bacterium]